MLSFRVKISNVWYTVAPIYNDFKIKRSRDKEQIFQIRTTADGVLTFFCPDFETLKTYAGTQLDFEITETICNETKIYNAILNVAPEINVFLKKITATVIIKDEYYTIYDKVLQSLEFDEDIDIYNAVTSSIGVYDLPNKISTRRRWDLNTLIAFLFNQINQRTLYEWAFYGVSQTPADELNVNTLVLTNENNIRFFNDTTETSQNFTISLKTLLDLLLHKFFIGWYLLENDGSIPNLPTSQFDYFVQFKKIESTVGFTNLLTINEDNSEKIYTILNEYDFSNLNYKTFDFDDTISDPLQSNFATVNVKFDVQKNNKKEIPLNCEVYLPKIEQKETNKIVMFECQIDNQSVELKTYQNQFYNSETNPFVFASGDGDGLTLSCNGVLSRIFYTLPENLVGSGNITFNFTANPIGANQLYFCHGNPNGSYTQIAVTSSNLIVINNFGQYYWFESSSIFSNYVLDFAQISYVPTLNSRYKIVSQNNNISTYELIKNFGANLPRKTATYKVGSINESFLVIPSKREQQTVLYNYQNTINNLNFWHKVQTSLTEFSNWWTIYEVERTYTNDYYSQVKLTLNR